jgi:hypothetical protein
MRTYYAAQSPWSFRKNDIFIDESLNLRVGTSPSRMQLQICDPFSVALNSYMSLRQEIVISPAAN